MAVRDESALTRTLNSLRATSAVHKTSSQQRDRESASKKAAEIELEFRFHLQKAAADNSHAESLLLFLQRTDVLGYSVPTTFAVQNPETGPSYEVKSSIDGDQRVCSICAVDGTAFCPIGSKQIQSVDDVVLLRRSGDTASPHIVLGLLLDALRSPAGSQDKALQGCIAQALLDILTAGHHRNATSSPVPAIPSSGLNRLIEVLLYVSFSAPVLLS